jgi:hypothetical protein
MVGSVLPGEGDFVVKMVSLGRAVFWWETARSLSCHEPSAVLLTLLLVQMTDTGAERFH